ncbi:MAG: hypothetical protein Q9214_006818, partial [Letrouitia sp. 1 TL-2023]
MLTSTLTFFLSLISLTLSLPSPFHQPPLRRDGPGSPFECDAKYNVASRKQELQNMGANALDLAITIQETSCNMSGKTYHFGDTYPPDQNGYRKPKTEDAANFGLFKNNWATIRANCRQFKGQ